MHQDIYKTIRDRIIHLEYAPGAILKEKTLAELLKPEGILIIEVPNFNNFLHDISKAMLGS